MYILHIYIHIYTCMYTLNMVPKKLTNIGMIKYMFIKQNS